MSDNLLFNWGGRGPEWEAIQRKLEQDAALMEQAMRIRFSQNAQTGGVGGGSKRAENLPITSGPALMLIYVDASDYWSMVVVNFEKGTVSDPINTGILYDGGNSYVVSRYNSTHNEGFMIVFYNDAILRTECFFVTAGGALVDTIVTFGGFDYGTLEYKGSWFADYEPDGEPTTEIILKMFDGVSVTTHTLSESSGISIGSFSGDLLSNIGAVATVYRTKALKEDIEVYLLRWDGTRELIFTHEANINYTMLTSSNSEFVVVFDQDSVSGNFIRARKWTGTNLTLEETALDDGDLVDSSIDFKNYGTNKAIAVFYKGSDSSIPWLVYQTSSNGTNLDTHAKGALQFSQADILTTPKEMWYPVSVINEKVVVIFYKSPMNGPVPDFSNYTYFDVLYYAPDGTPYETSITFPSFNRSIGYGQEEYEGGIFAKDPVIYSFEPKIVSEPILTLLTDTGVSTINTDPFSNDLNSFETYAVSPDYFLLRYTLTSEPGYTYWVVYDSTGEVDTFQTSANLPRNTPPVNLDGIVVIDEDDVSDSFAWSETTGAVILTGLTQGSAYSILGTSDVKYNFGTISARLPGYQVVLETPSGGDAPTKFFIFSSGGGWQGPFNTGLTGSESVIDIQLGESVFHYWWNDGDQIIADLYSLSTGQRISRYASGYPSENNVNEYGDRSFLSFDAGDDELYVFPTKKGVRTLTLPSTAITYSWNDSAWAND